MTDDPRLLPTEQKHVDRVWLWWEGRELRADFAKPRLLNGVAVEYMRVLSRKEVEKLASDEGVDVMQMVNSLHRTVEGQRKHIARLLRIEAAAKKLLSLVEAKGKLLSDPENQALLNAGDTIAVNEGNLWALQMEINS